MLKVRAIVYRVAQAVLLVLAIALASGAADQW